MRVLFLQDWNPLHGGAERFILDLREAFAEAGDEVRLLTAGVSPEARQRADYVAPASNHPVAKSVQQVHNPFAAAAVRRAVEAFRPEVALVNMFALYLSPAAVAALGKVPYVLLVSDYKCTCPLGHRLLPDGSLCHHPQGVACLRQGCLAWPHWLRDQLRYRRIRGVVSNAAAVVSSSEALRRGLAEQGIESQRVHLFSGFPDRSGFRRPAPEPKLLYVGRLDAEKGVDTLLRAFAIWRRSVPTGTLRIAGRGAQQPHLERLAQKLRVADAVSFLGWQTTAQIERELSEAWALVAPSRWPEPFGLVALEAVACGVPAVVPDLGGLAETIEHGVNGLKYPPNDAEALAAALIEVVEGDLFPARSLPPEAVARTLWRFSREHTVAALQSILRESAVNRPAA